ncbi:hypothetical protein LCGC14_0220570 [marine sediment metagenome]|uniref:Uncharacterized protein n=1 Tax=marine sediment metagenome TaxID=412755 RepID=A0A0F9WXM9_9ZZZZ
MERQKKFCPELHRKLNSLVNRCGGDENFVALMDEWPRTIKELIYGSEELMIRFRLLELIPDQPYDYESSVGMD